MTLSQHVRKAPAPGVTQFHSFSLSQRPLPRQVTVLHECGQRTPHSKRSRVPWHRETGYPLSRRHSSWQDKWGHDPAYIGRRHWAKRLHFTCLEAQIGPTGEAVKTNFNAACGLGPLSWVRGRFFLECHELPLVPYSLWGDHDELKSLKLWEFRTFSDDVIHQQINVDEVGWF